MFESLELAVSNLTSPPVLAFVLGLIAVGLRSRLEIPPQIFSALSIYLLLAIGIKGGVGLRMAEPADIAAPIALAIIVGLAIPIAAFAVLKVLTPLNQTERGAIAAARTLGRALATDLDLSVHFYGAVARSEARRALPEIRRGGFEDLAARQQSPAHEPDEGPAAPHITAGAVAVGVRPLMVAWNIELTGAPEAELLRAARSAAASMRGSAFGGVPNLQALGFALPSVHSAQLSMNLHDVIGAAKAGITLHSIRDRAEREARALGVQLGESEIVGLIPDAALRAGGDPGQTPGGRGGQGPPPPSPPPRPPRPPPWPRRMFSPRMASACR